MLTAKQEKFAQCVALEDMTYTDAYKTAYNTENMADKTVNEQACILANNPKIAARIAELRAEVAKDKIMSAQERLEWLTRLIKEQELETITLIVEGNPVEVQRKADFDRKLKAMAEMNKMTGEYVQRVVANVSYEDNLRKLVGEDEY